MVQIARHVQHARHRPDNGNHQLIPFPAHVSVQRDDADVEGERTWRIVGQIGLGVKPRQRFSFSVGRELEVALLCPLLIQATSPTAVLLCGCPDSSGPITKSAFVLRLSHIRQPDRVPLERTSTKVSLWTPGDPKPESLRS